MPTAPDRVYNLKKVVPFYSNGEGDPERLRFALPPSRTFAAGQVMAENKAAPGQADAVAAVTAPPAAPTAATATAGGSLVAGTYGYRITGNTANGETAPSAEVTQVVPAGTATNTVTLTLPALPAGITSFNVYGRTPGAERQIAAGLGAGAFVDTGAVAMTGAGLPAASGAFANPNLANLLGILEYDCFTDASGNVFKGDAANPDNISTIGAAVWVGGYFNVADLVGMTADVLALRKNARIVHGTLTTGVVEI